METNPWLDVPLADYEGHMRSVGQLDALAELLRDALLRCRPESVAVLGIAAGNGLEYIDPEITHRVVGLDINPAYLEVARQRYGEALHLELFCVDLAEEGAVPIEPVRLVHAAMVFEHAGTGPCLENALALVAPGGSLSVVLQLPGENAPVVGPSRFAAMQSLSPHFSLVDPGWLCEHLHHSGFRLDCETRRPLPGGKAFWMGIFANNRE